MKLSVVIPVYNEQDSIQEVIVSLQEILSKAKVDYELIIVNDGSTDNSGRILEKIKGIKLIYHPYNKGYGASLKTGIKAARNNLILMMDGDGTYPADAIPGLLRYADAYDMISGARMRNAHIPLSRRPAKFILSVLADFLTGRKIPDINCGMRLIKKDNVQKFFHILPSRFSFAITHLLACLTNDSSVKFVPIDYFKREGKSTIHPINDFIKFVTIIFRVVTYFRPLRFFSLISCSLIGIAFMVYLYNLVFMNRILMDLTIIVLFLSALQIFLFGLIADLLVKRMNQSN